MTRFVIPALLVAASVAVYLPALKFDFVMDDTRQIEMMESRFTWSQQFPSYFATDVWSYVQDHPTNYYRPIFVVWMLVTYQLFGLSHPLWHATAILVHAMAALLAVFPGAEIDGRPRNRPDFAEALLFARLSHTCRKARGLGQRGHRTAVRDFLFRDPQRALCASRQQASQDWNGAHYGGGEGDRAAVASFTMAIFAKETAVVLPALIFGFVWLFPESPGESSGKRARWAFSRTTIPLTCKV